MKKLASIGILILLCFNCLKAQTNAQTEPTFSNINIKPAHIIVEGLITNISYFRDTTEAIKNYRLRNPSRDNDDAIWFVKYTIEVQKVFKGQKITTVTVIDQNRDREIYLNNREITLKIGRQLHGGNLSNFPLNSLSIFFLKKDFVPNLNAIKNENIYSFTEIRCVGDYNSLRETRISIREKGFFDEDKEFENLEEFYKYLEKETKTKKIDITHKHFFVNNTLEKERNYIGTHFGDSSNSESFIKKIRNGTINQLNADSFLVKQKPPLTKKELRLQKRERIRKGEEAKIKFKKAQDKIKEDLNYYKKTGSLNKLDEKLNYRKICLSCILANINTEHIAPMVA